MLRAGLIIALMAVTTPAAAQVTGSLPPRPVATLRPAVTVTADVVRIGDMVENAGPVSAIPIFRSPDCGTTGSVPVAMVLEAIRAHDLLLIDTRNLSDISVTRAGRTIGLKEIEERIARAFTGRQKLGSAKDIAVVLDREARPILADTSATGELQVTRSFYDPRSGRFDIVFDLAASGGRVIRQRYAGTLAEMADVTVLTRALERGDVIRDADVAVERRPRTEIPGDFVRGAEDAVGSAVRQSLRAGWMLRRADLTKPEWVRRDEPVTIVYESPGLVLTLRGKAVDSGSQGELVNVVNVQSKRQLQGYVTAPGRVTIPSTATSVAFANRVPGDPTARPVSQ